MAEKSDNEKESIIVEFVSVGKSVKVTAIDPVSSKEVSIVGSPKASRQQLSALAVRKLRYVLNRDQDKSE